jgi:predicted dehydrogenase
MPLWRRSLTARTITNNRRNVTRRSAIKTLGAAAGWTIVPRTVLGGGRQSPPSDRITLACIGVGSQGLRVMMNFLQQPDVQVVSVCDVNRGSDDYVEWGQHELRDKVRKLLGDQYASWGGSDGSYRGGIAGREPAREIVDAYYGTERRSGSSKGCAAFEDFRELLSSNSDVDAIIVGTPDHLHAVVSIAALRAGKHVFCQKPMAHSVFEASRMADVSRETHRATQVAVGNQASEATRQLCEWMWGGAIGPVRHVLNWSNRPFWPQGVSRPETEEPVPSHLNWDLWLGPAASRPYHHAYQPFVWRGWYDFGAGALGDMGCYSFDTIFRVLKLEAPSHVEGSSTERFPESFPKASILHFDFPPRGDMPSVRVTWYDGGLKPPTPEELDEPALEAEGLLFVGDKGKILCGFNGAKPRLIPKAKMDAFSPPPPSLPRSPGNEREWLDACKGGAAGGADFPFSARVTETLLLGNIALRTGERLVWDPAARAITNVPKANELLRREYRDGWSL